MEKRMKEALEKVTSELLSLDEETFLARLNEHEDGIISRMFKDSIDLEPAIIDCVNDHIWELL